MAEARDRDRGACPHGLYLWEACTACLRQARDEARARVAEIERENWVIYQNTKGRIEKAEGERDYWKATASDALDARDRLRRLLRRLEWASTSNMGAAQCPSCGNEESEGVGHTPTCALDAALRDS